MIKFHVEAFGSAHYYLCVLLGFCVFIVCVIGDFLVVVLDRDDEIIDGQYLRLVMLNEEVPISIEEIRDDGS